MIIHQRFFHNFDFFVFFINIFVGLYSFVCRLVLNFTAGFLWISRLDKAMLPRGYEFIDPGYRTYVGFLLLDYHYCNPSVVTFANLLSDHAKQRRRARRRYIRNVSVTSVTCGRKGGAEGGAGKGTEGKVLL